MVNGTTYVAAVEVTVQLYIHKLVIIVIIIVQTVN